MKSRIALPIGIAVLALFPCAALAQTPCEKLADVTLTNATVTSATSVAAGSYKPPAGPGQPAPSADLPAFCRVAGIAKPTSDSEIHFEVWLPVSGWNNKYEQVGNGGFAGTIPFSAMAQALLEGYATAGTDDGHAAAPNAKWAVGHPGKGEGLRLSRRCTKPRCKPRRWSAPTMAKLPLTSISSAAPKAAAKALLKRSAILTISRASSGSPAINWNRADARPLGRARARGNYRQLSSRRRSCPSCRTPRLPPATRSMVTRTASSRILPSAISIPPRFNARATMRSDCLTAAQVIAAKKIYAPLTNPRTGALIEQAFRPAGRRYRRTGRYGSPVGARRSRAFGKLFANQFFADMVFENPQWDPKSFNFDTDVKLMDDKLGDTLNSMDTNLRAFKEHGGKLIQYHGWSDAAISPLGSVGYFESVQKTMGDTKGFYRLFMVPTMSHCAGGPAPRFRQRRRLRCAARGRGPRRSNGARALGRRR